MTALPNVLVIKLGALGDFVQALGPFAAIRRHHAGARLTLLTTAPYAGLARASGWFDDVWLDARPKPAQWGQWLALRRRLRGAGFARVYDLQTSDRSSFYFQLFRPGPMPEWSGIAKGCSHPHANSWRDGMHTLDRQAEQLRMAGIAEVPRPDLSWIEADVGRFGLPEAYGLLVPGGAAHRPAKRWPAERYAELACLWLERGVTPVFLGAAGEGALLAEIANAVPGAVNLGGRTDLFDLAVLARGARGAVGNDTGPMHLIAAAGCPSAVLFSAASDPALCAPRGPMVTVLRRESLTDLPLDAVAESLEI